MPRGFRTDESAGTSDHCDGHVFRVELRPLSYTELAWLTGPEAADRMLTAARRFAEESGTTGSSGPLRRCARTTAAGSRLWLWRGRGVWSLRRRPPPRHRDGTRAPAGPGCRSPVAHQTARSRTFLSTPRGGGGHPRHSTRTREPTKRWLAAPIHARRRWRRPLRAPGGRRRRDHRPLGARRNLVLRCRSRT